MNISNEVRAASNLKWLTCSNCAILNCPYAVVAAASGFGGGGGAGRSYSHSLLGQAMTGPAFRFFSTRYSLPQLGHFSAMGLCAEVNLHFG